MQFIPNFIVFLYSLVIVLILLYSLSQLLLFINYLKSKNTHQPNQIQEFDLPFVTVQLPIYNEKYVVKRLLDNIIQINYPKNKFEIQVLDDSTDQSLGDNLKMIEQIKLLGFDIVHIHRQNRENYKAGALKNGLNYTKGEFIAIFDADFLPQKEWLKQVIGHFKNDKIGVVQTRWAHINRNYSILTKVQAMALDHHFTIEQKGRNIANHFVNFNGTAGIWRKKCIINAGNWQGDTLTEDLDLSYRAQLQNYKFVYLEDIGTPSELPMAMSAIRSQQFRWNKGGAENFRKNIKFVLKSKTIGLSTKLQAVAHLLNSSVFVWAFLLSILSVPMILIKPESRFLISFLQMGSIVKYNYVLLLCVFYISFRKTQSKSLSEIPKFILQYLMFFPVILGLTFHNTLAVLEGLLGIKSEFVRTPKFNMHKDNLNWKSNNYLNKKISLSVFIELLLVIYFMFGLYLGYYYRVYGFMAFHFVLICGYSYIFSKSINE